MFYDLYDHFLLKKSMNYNFLNYYLSTHLFIFPPYTNHPPPNTWFCAGGKTQNIHLLTPRPLLISIYKHRLQHIPTDFRRGQREGRHGSFHPSCQGLVSFHHFSILHLKEDYKSLL